MSGLAEARKRVAEVRDCLVRFRFECQDAGLWPGALTLRWIQQTTHAMGSLIDTLFACDDCEGLPSCWPLIWGPEVARTLKAVGSVCGRMTDFWRPFMQDYVDQMPTLEDRDLIENKPGSIETPVTREWLAKPVPDDAVHVIERCITRLEFILREGPHESDVFVPSEAQRQVLTALENRAMTLEALAHEVGVEKSTLHRTSLTELMSLGKIVSDRRKGGYYRPDAPPE